MFALLQHATHSTNKIYVFRFFHLYFHKLIQMASILVSEAEKVYVLHGVQEDLRCDGRGRKDVRPIVVETDIGNQILRLERIGCVLKITRLAEMLKLHLNFSVTHASGSAHLRLANTDVLVGVKGILILLFII